MSFVRPMSQENIVLPAAEQATTGYSADEMQLHLHTMIGMLKKIFTQKQGFSHVNPNLVHCIQSLEEVIKLLNEDVPFGDTAPGQPTHETSGLKFHQIHFLEKVRKFIDDHIRDPEFDISALARELHMSNSNLYRKVRAASGMSALDFLKGYKMTYAARLLLSGLYSIKEVSCMTGFKDARYFSTCFKKYFDQTPTAYRRMAGQKVYIL